MWFQWIAIMIVSFQFIGAALTKLTGGMCEFFLSNGMTIEFMYFIGFLETISVLGLFFVTFRVKASLILMLIMMGALITHIPNEQMVMELLNIANIGLLSIIIWAELDKKYQADDMVKQEAKDNYNF